MTAILEQNPDLVLDQSADDYWNRYQLTFALYSVSDRAIPSAFDGLKPGQRRLLYQMHDSRLLPGNKPQKSSKVCSAVTGNLHPHGGASMYGAAALMAAEFQRVKVIDGQGAFPRIQGDVPAADRYTEMRLSAPGAALTAELDDHAVPMVQTFDGEWTEPTMLPAQWPVLLCNGAMGIAEGWATKVPAHNPREVMAACRALLARPNTTDDTLVKLIPGPDWGCGATVVGTAGLREYITTGRGAFTVRGTVLVDGKNVIVTELPPGVASNTVQERIRALVESGEMSGVADMSDLTDRRNGLRIVVTAKRGHSAETIRDQLLALTPLESTFAASLVALDENRVPRWWSVRELIGAFLHLRDSVVLRRSEYRLDKVSARRHLVAGLMKIHLDIDAAVAVIRGSDTVEDARQGLQERFKIDEEQANYVLALQLRRLTKLDVIELQAEADKLDAEFAELTELVSKPDARRKVIDQELVETAKLFKGPEFDRRTVLDFDATPVTAGSDEDGPRERKVNAAWRLDDRGVFSDSHGDLLSSGLGWAVWADGRIKFTTGSGSALQDPRHPGGPGHHRAGAVRRPDRWPPPGSGDSPRKSPADRPRRGESAGGSGQRGGRGEACGRWRRGGRGAACVMRERRGNPFDFRKGLEGNGSRGHPGERSRWRRRRVPPVRQRRGRRAVRVDLGDRVRAAAVGRCGPRSARSRRSRVRVGT